LWQVPPILCLRFYRLLDRSNVTEQIHLVSRELELVPVTIDDLLHDLVLDVFLFHNYTIISGFTGAALLSTSQSLQSPRSAPGRPEVLAAGYDQ
jgi:hypothetical protein